MLEVNNISFSYTEEKIIKSLSFQLKQGEMLTLIGESGSGKSTILKLLYGILEPQVGEIWFDGRKLGGNFGHLVPGEPEFKYLAQDFELTLYATVAENVGNFLSNIRLEEKQNKVRVLLDLVDMADFADVRAHDLSGGQKQRVALAKALAQMPKLLLLDEPFSQIDTFKKNMLKRAVFEFAGENHISIILATHEVSDALAFADRMIVLKNGKVIQENTPEQIYKNPENEYVARLFGEVNLLGQNFVEEFIPENAERKILAYPHQLKFSTDKGLRVKVIKSYFMGSHYLVEGIYQLHQIWFNSSEFLPKGNEYYIKISDYQVCNE
ncbi:MAG: ABC transporter ATP-binding protein [Flavobacteriaceae bacterium]|jgi:ABC-type Fe3+/spermidine/putrescine transport system ATPase subunit|nr:ABC transporter ATP-binding protein [Flavobacteriaceae bacterium]